MPHMQAESRDQRPQRLHLKNERVLAFRAEAHDSKPKGQAKGVKQTAHVQTHTIHTQHHLCNRPRYRQGYGKSMTGATIRVAVVIKDRSIESRERNSTSIITRRHETEERGQHWQRILSISSALGGRMIGFVIFLVIPVRLALREGGRMTGHWVLESVTPVSSYRWA